MSFSLIYPAVPFSIFLLIGVFSSWSDFKTRRVPNRLIIAAFIVVSIGYIVLFWLWPFKYLLRLQYFNSILIHLLLSAILALGLWYWRIWPAGDAKLFVFMSLVIILVRPHLWGFPYWTFLQLAINTFIIAACFIIPLALYHEWHNFQRSPVEFFRQITVRMRRLIGEIGLPRGIYLIRLIFNFAIIFIFSRILMEKISSLFSGLPKLLVFLVIYFFWGKIYPRFYRVSRIPIFSLFPAAFLALLIHFLHMSFSKDVLNGLFLGLEFFLLFAVLKFLERLIRTSQIHARRVGELNPGDILNDESWNGLVESCSAVAPEHEFLRYADGLSQEDVTVIRNSCPAEKEVIICETRPFAFWIFIGALWTLFMEQTFPQWLISFWRAHF